MSHVAEFLPSAGFEAWSEVTGKGDTSQRFNCI